MWHIKRNGNVSGYKQTPFAACLYAQRPATLTMVIEYTPLSVEVACVYTIHKVCAGYKVISIRNLRSVPLILLAHVDRT